MPWGFANLTPEQRREMSRKGGKAAQAKGTAHRWDSWSAAAAGRKGVVMRMARRMDRAAHSPPTEGNA